MRLVIVLLLTFAGASASAPPKVAVLPVEVAFEQGLRRPAVEEAVDLIVAKASTLPGRTWLDRQAIGPQGDELTLARSVGGSLDLGRMQDADLLVLCFGVSGKLRKSDMVMYDRETESWWQQAVGEGIVGDMTGVELTQLPTWMESWREFSTRNPDGLVMDEPGWTRPYGSNPYVGYDRSARPFLYRGELPPHGVPALARVIRVGDIAWTMERVRTEGPITEAGVTLSWTEGQASALDSDVIADSREVGTIRVKDANGNDVPHDVLFAFAYHAFWPDGTWMLGE